MIEKTLLGKTSYGGELYLLEGEPASISALRCVVSSGKIGKQEATVNEAIEYFNKYPQKTREIVKTVFGARHSSIGELSSEAFYFTNVSRLFSFLGWMPIGGVRGFQGVGTEESLRRVKAKGFVADNQELEDVCRRCFDVYYKLVEEGVKLEDARYVLPMATTTEQIIQIPRGRELGKWANYLSSLFFSEAKQIGSILRKWNEEQTGLEVDEKPSEENYMPIFSKDKIESRINWEREICTTHGSYMYDDNSKTLVVRGIGSIASYHQEVRDRQEILLWPSWEDFILSSRYVIPQSLVNREDVIQIYELAIDKGKYFWKRDIESAALCQPLGKEMGVVSTIHGLSNIKYTIMLRTCEMAQWEIRERFKNIAEVMLMHGVKVGPRCEIEGRCFEMKRKNCPNFKR